MKVSSLSRLDLISLAIIAVSLGFVLFVYPQLPEQFPVHWNSAGDINGYSSRLVGAFIMPVIAIIVVALFKILVRISPIGFKLDESRGVVDIIQTVLVALFCTIGIAMVLVAIGYKLDMVKVIVIGTGLMLMATGNVLSKVRKNFFVGIRTPWTLADDEVWAQTHRFAGRSFFAGGLLICSIALVKPHPVVIVVAVVIAALSPVVYSFIVYRRLHSGTEG